MIEFYLQIRAVHLAAVGLSLGWFALRWLALGFAARWPRWIAARALGWTIDGTLFTAATMLWTSLPGAVFANHWLTVKLVFVAGYLGLAWTSLQPGLPGLRRWGLGLAALVCFVLAYGIARAHNPLGWFA